MNRELRHVTALEANVLSALVHASFLALAAGDWEPSAREVFLGESSPENLAQAISSATYAAAEFKGNAPIGFILMPRPNLLGMLFVSPLHLREGVARRLWGSGRTFIEANYPETKTVELNSTPYALAAYKALGFVPISTEFRRGGCSATRMACWLPARGLGAECAPIL